ncbi:HEAT repeat domain-containing protein [Anaeromyxobacter oryzae]|uniref:HEAT repeat domain-containing protein n=1 Tax=Anaeromyxobacter oryzae TaxID=2918170 RepID=A0ABN6MYH4_9BACT|nr:HEAT repeat domain-containing protein [Anaeromyxobacter oryzae]BDG06004.1 hypothetical protein AMOR_50000 [Anaeromyxobacter oryzae]
MRRPLVALLLATLTSIARADPQADRAIRALHEDPSLKVRVQAALVLGQGRVTAAVPALRGALANDEASAVRIAAAAALGRIGDPAARPALEGARDADPDDSVRAAAARALEALPAAAAGARVVSLEDAAGEGGREARTALRDALGKHLRAAGFTVAASGGLRLKPSVLRVDVSDAGGKTIVAVSATLVAVEAGGRMAAMVQGGARLSASGRLSPDKRIAYAVRALDAAARTLSEDLAARLGER